MDRWKLKWKDHVHTVESKIAKNLGFLYQEKHFLDEHCFKQICFTYVHAYLNYANIICASTHKTKLKKVQSNLKHDSRIIFNQSKTSSSKSFFIGLNVPKVDRINIFQSVQFMHRQNNKRYSAYLPKTIQCTMPFLSNKLFLITFSAPRIFVKTSRFAISVDRKITWNNCLSTGRKEIDNFLLFKQSAKEKIMELCTAANFFQ